MTTRRPFQLRLGTKAVEVIQMRAEQYSLSMAEVTRVMLAVAFRHMNEVCSELTKMQEAK